MKELWQVPTGRVEPGLIQHSLGWPLDTATYGGSFIYHLDQDRVYVGFVAGLDYSDPNFRPFEAFQQFKNHPQYPTVARGRRNPGRRRTHHRRRRLAVDSATGDARRRAHRRHRRWRERAEDQGRAPGHPLRRHWRPRSSCRPDPCRASRRAGVSPRAGRNCKAVRNIKPGFKRGLWLGLANAATGNGHRRQVTLDAQAQTRSRAAAYAAGTDTGGAPLGRSHAAAARSAGLGVLCRSPRMRNRSPRT